MVYEPPPPRCGGHPNITVNRTKGKDGICQHARAPKPRIRSNAPKFLSQGDSPRTPLADRDFTGKKSLPARDKICYYDFAMGNKIPPDDPVFADDKYYAVNVRSYRDEFPPVHTPCYEPNFVRACKGCIPGHRMNAFLAAGGNCTWYNEVIHCGDFTHSKIHETSGPYDTLAECVASS